MDKRTQIVQAQIGTDPAYGSITPPLYMSSTYLWDDIDAKGCYDYGRSNNPNRTGLAQALAELEGGSGGIITASGMSAIDLCLNLIQADDWVIAPHDCYGGTHRLFTHRAAQGRVRVKFINQADPDQWTQALAHNPAMVFIETPSNPLMRLVDIAQIAKAAKAAGAIIIADNTFLSPLRMQPLSLGCDIAVHSTTKYLNGHSDVVGGAVICKSQAHYQSLDWWANCAGVTASPFDAFQTLRGLRTLSLRLDAQEANALAIAQFLSTHPSVAKVYYPGLKADPHHDLMLRQQSGPGAMLSFALKGRAELAVKFTRHVRLFRLAASLGGVESLICQPATMTHGGMDAQAQKQAGISANLLRLSVGIEAKQDLLADLDQALSAIASF